MSRPTYEELERRITELEAQAGERMRLGEKERCEKEKAQEYLDIAGVAIVAMNARGEVTLINRKGCEILGYPEEEVMGRSWFDHFLPERARDEVKRVFFDLLSGDIEPVEHFQNPVLTATGEERMIAWYNTLIRDESGKPVGTISSGEDVTERVKAEEALRRAHEELSRFSMDLEKIVEQRTEELKEKSKQLLRLKSLPPSGGSPTESLTILEIPSP